MSAPGVRWYASNGSDANGPCAFCIAHGGRLIAMADAIGFQAQTSGAAMLAVQSFIRTVGEPSDDGNALQELLNAGFQVAHRTVASDPTTLGLAAAPDAVAMTTLALAGTRALIAHAGNTHCYRVRAGSVAVLTRDHSAVAEMRNAQGPAAVQQDAFHTHHRNYLTRGLGLGQSITPDVSNRSARGGDRFVLCSASVWSALSDGQLRQFLRQGGTAEHACRALRAQLGEFIPSQVMIVVDLQG